MPIIPRHKLPSETVILIDIDDTISCLCKPWCEWLNSKYGTKVEYEDIYCWDICRFFPTLTKEQVFDPLYLDEFWHTVKPKRDAPQYIKKLIDDGFNVYLCTSTDYRNIEPKFENIIQKYFPYIKWEQVIVTSNKQMIKADFLIDDGVHNLEGGGYTKILFTAPHNKSYDAKANGMFRVKDWAEAYALITNI